MVEFDDVGEEGARAQPQRQEVKDATPSNLVRA